MSKSIPVYHKPGGYEAYKDQVPITKPNWRIISMMVGGIFICGVISAISLFAVSQFFLGGQPKQNTESIPVVETTMEAFSALISEPLPTFTPSVTPTATMEATIEPTLDLEATLNAVSAELEALQSQPLATTPPTQTPNVIIETTQVVIEPTEIIYGQYAVVTVDCSIVRAAPGREYRALDSACRGAEYPVLDTYGQWTRILHPSYETAWIASWLVRIENR